MEPLRNQPSCDPETTLPSNTNSDKTPDKEISKNKNANLSHKDVIISKGNALETKCA